MSPHLGLGCIVKAQRYIISSHHSEVLNHPIVYELQVKKGEIADVPDAPILSVKVCG